MRVYFLLAQTRTQHIAGWSSLVARRAHNPKAVGSNPAPATIKCLVGTREGPYFYAWGTTGTYRVLNLLKSEVQGAIDHCGEVDCEALPCGSFASECH